MELIIYRIKRALRRNKKQSRYIEQNKQDADRRQLVYTYFLNR